MAKILDAYTLCQTIFHVEQSLGIRLQKPQDSLIVKAKEKYGFQEAKLDGDSDFIATSGEILSKPEVKIRAITFYASQNRLSVDILGGKTKDCADVIISLLNILYGLSEDDLKSGTTYIEYKTVTKCQFSSQLDGLFSENFQQIIKKWRSFKSQAIVSTLSSSIEKSLHGAISISEEYFNRMFEGQEKIFVMPSEITFYAFVPTKYYKMSKYKVSLQTQSFEDFTDGIYFLTTELPYDDHIELVESLDNMG